MTSKPYQLIGDQTKEGSCAGYEAPSQVIETTPTQGNLPLVAWKPGKFIRWLPGDHTPRGLFITDGFKHQSIRIGKHMAVGTIY